MFNILCKFLILIFFVSGKAGLALTHNRPVTSLPKVIHPAEVVDIYSYGLIPQLHETLFDLTKDNRAKSNIVDNYSIKAKGKKWHFKIKKLWFHNDQLLTSSHIKRSLEYAIKKKAINYIMTFSNIRRLHRFYRRKNK